MKQVLFTAFTILIFSAAQGASKDIRIVSPKPGSWLPPTEDKKTLEVIGRTAGFPNGTEIKLSILSSASKLSPIAHSKIDEKGEFKFTFLQNEIPSAAKSQLVVNVIQANKSIASASVEVFCCSTEPYGFFKEVKIGSDQSIKVAGAGAEIDGSEIFIPKNAIERNSKVFVTVQRYMQDISIEKYTPLSAAVNFEMVDFRATTGMKIIMTATPSVPRTENGVACSRDTWESYTDRPWKNVDLKSAKIVVLGHNRYEFEWHEIVPSRIMGNKVEFLPPTVSDFDRFMLVARYP
jgi:hypothetical protein